MDIGKYIYKKEVDWSLLNQGFSIPITVQVIFQKKMNGFIQRGQSKDISLLIDGQKYSAKLINQKFDEAKYPKHKDILQIRYNPNSEIAIKLRDIFSYTFINLNQKRNFIQQTNKQKKIIKIPKNEMEYIALYMTDIEDVFILDCIVKSEIDQSYDILSKQDEYEFEKIINYNIYDYNAGMEIKERAVKIRKLDKSIGDSLKLLYDYKCQICGNDFGKDYNAKIVETHHIDPFVKSLNNNASNQIIICPNHHSVIHYANPMFNRKKLSFIYNNGYEEGLILNSHL